MSDPLVQCRDLVLKRGPFTLKIPRWDVQPGEVVGVVGTNGAGKSSLLMALAGRLNRTSGEVRVFGYDPQLYPRQVRERMGFMTDDALVYGVSIGAALHLLSGYYPTWDHDWCDELIQRLKLDPHAEATGLSKGQRTRFNLVAALAYRPEVLVLDEPATGLDLAGRRELLKVVLEAMRDDGGAVIISSHQLTDVARISDALLVLDQGRVVQQGSAPELVGTDRTLEEAMVDWGLA
jgi:ABC-2 type transport system ATP-binding protein